MKKNQEETASKFVLVIELADHLGRSKNGTLYAIKRLGLTSHLVRGHTGKPTLAITAEDAKKIMDADIKEAVIVRPGDLGK